jgi:type I restriction enzyme, S subunit
MTDEGMSRLPMGWIDATIGDCADIQLGKMLDKTKNKGDPTLYLRNINVRWGSFDLSDVLEMRFTPEEREFFSIKDDDLIVCEGGEPGRAAIWRSGPTELKYQKALHRVRLSEGVVPDFVYYFLRHASQQGFLDSLLTGTTIKHLPRTAFLRLNLSLPPTNEQRRIVAKLDSLLERTRRAREELSQIPRLIEHYKKAILEAAFRGGLTRDWRRTDELVQWNTLSLSELLAEPLSNGRSVPDGNGFPVLRLTALKKRILDLSERKLGNWDRSQAAHYVVKPGDFFVSRGNGSLDLVARGSYIEVVDEDVAFPDTMIRIRPDLAKIHTPFLYHQWSYVGVRSQIVSMAKTTAGIYKVSQTDLNRVQLAVPPLEEQEEIVRRIEKALNWLKIVEAEEGQATHLLNRLDQANLAKAFRGELVPQDPNDEPASVLLDRIRSSHEGRSAKNRRTRKQTEAIA